MKDIKGSGGTAGEVGTSMRLVRVLIVVAGWIFGGAGCYASNNGAELSYKFGYLITAASFFPVRPVPPDRQVSSVPATIRAT